MPSCGGAATGIFLMRSRTSSSWAPLWENLNTSSKTWKSGVHAQLLERRATCVALQPNQTSLAHLGHLRLSHYSLNVVLLSRTTTFGLCFFLRSQSDLCHSDATQGMECCGCAKWLGASPPWATSIINSLAYGSRSRSARCVRSKNVAPDVALEAALAAMGNH